MLGQIAREIASLHDFSKYFPSYNYPLLERELCQAGIGISGREWFSFGVGSALIASIFAALGGFALLFNAGISLALIPICLALTSGIILIYPAYRRKKRAEELEGELLIAIREIITELGMGMPFENMVGRMAGGKFGVLSEEFGRIGREIENGATVKEALERFGARNSSEYAIRLSQQLSLIYLAGSGPEPLLRLADEIANSQRNKSTEFEGKMAIFGLLFIAISCIIPSLFAAYLIVGSSFMALSISESEIYLAYLLLFPALNVLVLSYIKEKTPAIISY